MGKPDGNHGVGDGRQEHARERPKEGQPPKRDGGDGKRRRLRGERGGERVHDRTAAAEHPPARRTSHERALEAERAERRPQRPREVPAQGAQSEDGAHGEEEPKVAGKVRVEQRHAERHDARGARRVRAPSRELRAHRHEGHEPGADRRHGRPAQQHEGAGRDDEQGNPTPRPEPRAPEHAGDDPRDDGEVASRHGDQVGNPTQLDELVGGVAHQRRAVPAAHARGKRSARGGAGVQCPDEGLPEPEDGAENAIGTRGAPDVRDAHGRDDSPCPARGVEVVVTQLPKASHARDGMAQPQLPLSAEVHVCDAPAVEARPRPGEVPAAGGVGVLVCTKLERRDGDRRQDVERPPPLRHGGTGGKASKGGNRNKNAGPDGSAPQPPPPPQLQRARGQREEQAEEGRGPRLGRKPAREDGPLREDGADQGRDRDGKVGAVGEALPRRTVKARHRCRRESSRTSSRRSPRPA